MTRGQDRFLLVVGGLAVVLVWGGLVIVEANTGPFEHEIQHAEFSSQVTGTYTVTEDTGQAPVCADDVTGEGCPTRTELDLVIDGLPELRGQARYLASLVAGDEAVPLDELDDAGEAHTLSFAGEIDGDAHEHLAIQLTKVSQPEDAAIVVATMELPTSEGETVDIDRAVPAGLGEARGEVSLAQIGAVEIAVTANGRVDGLPSVPGWTYQAWLLDEDEPAWTPLNALDTLQQPAVLDARMERVELVEQERFVITLEPTVERPASPEGFPVVDLAVNASSLLD